MRWVLWLAGVIGFLLALPPDASAAEVDFNREVRPILVRGCFKCHGPDEKARQAGLRLDRRESAISPVESGNTAIVPGQPEASEVVRRIQSTDDADRMPPPHAKYHLSDAEKSVLSAWIAEGADYEPHWAFQPPRSGPLPSVRQSDWPRNPIDHFVLARMEAEGLLPSPEADRSTLLRRVYLDLIGLPPSPEEAKAFLEDPSPTAYESLVDRLLQSPHYGERWARRWLDLARYADTNGYEKDRPRSIWPYRDWVIDSINQDMPFDQFTIEQIAGDMLPDASASRKIATGFHRNTMLNEEGGIDPLEFRFHAMTDRVATTGTVWLGLTLLCCQCHTHKYDPIAQREYYGIMAYLNNADEPVMEIPREEAAAHRRESEAKIAAIVADLPNRFPLADEFEWHEIVPATAMSLAGATLEIGEGGVILASGPDPETDIYTVSVESALPRVDAVRIEALADPKLPSKGPGRTPHGNFVLSEFSVTTSGTSSEANAKPIKLVGPTADFAQEGFPAASAIDGQPGTGWAIHGPGEWNVDRAATFPLETPELSTGTTRWTFRLDQSHGGRHTLGKFRLRLGTRSLDSGSESERRRAHLERKFAAWAEGEAKRVVAWTPLTPTEAKANMPLLTILEDGSILASSDQTKRDVYDLRFRSNVAGVTAIRLEAIPDDRLPGRGPGRVYYEGGNGDFFLSDLTLSVDGKPARFASASQSFAAGATKATNAIDDNPQSGWSINGGQGRPQEAVFQLAEPLAASDSISMRLVFEMYYAAGLGRFRIWGTTDTRPAVATGLPHEVEKALLVPPPERTGEAKGILLRQFLATAPELATERAAIEKIRGEMPAPTTTLVMAERPANDRRPTYLHNRGEYLQPLERIEPGIPEVLPRTPPNAPADRLTFARWLVSAENPLTARVTMNRDWAAIFGKGIVTTLEDFGFQGEPPTHPELLDWLALEFIRQGWSRKQMHRLLVTSATYRQDSRVTPDSRGKDPRNRWLARGPRFRVEAELVRDSALAISGLLSPKIGGPSVFPPQPAGVASEGAYGGFPWNTSSGPDRYRRGLYTFSKRTAPYAMFNAFDSPSGEACVARREISNTPLQALAVMNDTVFWEAAQALGAMFAAKPGTVEERLDGLFRRCLIRPPRAEESRLLAEFHATQHARFMSDPKAALALERKPEGAPASDPKAEPPPVDKPAEIAAEESAAVIERATWTAIARALLNLDETITKN